MSSKRQITKRLHEIKDTMMKAELVKGQYMLWDLIDELEREIEEERQKARRKGK